MVISCLKPPEVPGLHASSLNAFSIGAARRYTGDDRVQLLNAKFIGVHQASGFAAAAVAFLQPLALCIDKLAALSHTHEGGRDAEQSRHSGICLAQRIAFANWRTAPVFA